MIAKIILWVIVLFVYWVISVAFYVVMTTQDDGDPEMEPDKYWYISAPVCLTFLIIVTVIGIVTMPLQILVHLMIVLGENAYDTIRGAFCRA